MQTNLINSYMHAQTKTPQSVQPKPSDEIEIVTRRKAKPDFDINRELANRTFIRPLPPKGHIVKDGIMSAPAVFVDDLAYDMKALKAAWKGEANDHQLGRLNDLGMKLGGLGIASYLFTIKKSPVKKGMEFVGLASFFASMTLWPKLFLELPARMIHGFNPFMRYEDSQGRKKPFFQDNQYLPFDMLSDKQINKIGNRNRIPKYMPNRRDAIQEKTRQIALQNNTMWMLTAGFATPVMSSLICNKLEPYVENVYSYFMNKKVDDILLDFSAAQKKYRPVGIERDVNSLLEMYKGRVVDEKIIGNIAAALTQELNPKVEAGMKADLMRMFGGDKYNVSDLQIKPLIKAMTETVKKSANSDVINQNLTKIIPTVEQVNGLFAPVSGKQMDAQGLKKIADELATLIENNLDKLRNEGVRINRNLHKNIIKNLYGKSELDGPLMSVLTNSPTSILDDNAQNIIRKIAAQMTAFCAENNALSMYSFKKLASAADTSKGKFWNDVAKPIIDILKITPEELENTRYDRLLVAKLLNSKMAAIASDNQMYDQIIKAAAANLAKINNNVKPDDLNGKYIKQLEMSYDVAAKAFNSLGLTKTVEKLVGKNGCEVGSLLGISRSFVSDNLMNVRNSFARFFNAMNFYKAVANDPNLNFANKIYDMNGNVTGELFAGFRNIYDGAGNVTGRAPGKLLREIKEEIFALADYLAVSGRISDYSVKFEFLRNLKPNMTDESSLEFNKDGSVKYKYYNKAKLATDGVFIPSDTNFFKRVMNALYGGQIQPETSSALEQYLPVKGMLEDFRRNMMNEVGNSENFAFPSKVVHDMWENGNRKYSKASPNRMSLFVGSALDDMITNTARQAYNTQKWLKTFGGFFAGLAGFTVLSQFFFGRVGNRYKKDKV